MIQGVRANMIFIDDPVQVATTGATEINTVTVAAPAWNYTALPEPCKGCRKRPPVKSGLCARCLPPNHRRFKNGLVR